MQNIKNFKKYEPTPEQVHADLLATGKIFKYLISEDGLDWYDCQQLFADMTVKLMYDSNNVIRSIVSEPVPGRGYIYAVSMFYPEGMSVAETERALPDGFELDTGTWLFDGELVYQDADLLASYNFRKNKSLRLSLATNATTNIAVLQAGLASNCAKTGDSDALILWGNYLCNLRDMTDEALQQSSVLFPEQPASIL